MEERDQKEHEPGSLSEPSTGWRDYLVIVGPALLLAVAGFVVTYQFVDPAPPERFVMATGSEEGAYFAFGSRYAELLADEGFTVEVKNTKGSTQNLELLQDPGSEVGVAFVQGGTGRELSDAGLESLGSLYFEPIWVFHRADQAVSDLSELRGRRIAVGPVGSGTRAVALLLLRENGVDVPATTLVPISGSSAFAALQEGEVDAAFFVISAGSPMIGEALRNPALQLMSFQRAAAYERRHRYLSQILLPRGVVDLEADLPPEDVLLLAPTANLVIREDFHPALQALLLQVAERVHRGGGLFERPGDFPSPSFVEFPLSQQAHIFHETGPSFLQRYLPFWAASMIDRLKVMILPVLVFLLPLFRIMPATFEWRVRRRVYRWYRMLQDLERNVHADPRPESFHDIIEKLDSLDRDVARIWVPLSYADELYNLRLHIDLVRATIRTYETKAAEGPAHSASREG